ARRAIALAERTDGDELRLLSMRLLSAARTSQGDVEAGKSLVQQALSEARALGLRSVESACLNGLSIIAGMQDDLVANLELTEQGLAISREIGDRRGEAGSLNNMGVAW